MFNIFVSKSTAPTISVQSFMEKTNALELTGTSPKFR